jgi:hypothetical protein
MHTKPYTLDHGCAQIRALYNILLLCKLQDIVMIYPFSLLLNNPVVHHSRTIQIIPECLTGLLCWSHLLINLPYH